MILKFQKNVYDLCKVYFACTVISYMYYYCVCDCDILEKDGQFYKLRFLEFLLKLRLPRK